MKVKTKNGHEVIIHELKCKGTFCIKGTILKKGRKWRYDIWLENGRYSIFRESGFDLVL